MNSKFILPFETAKMLKKAGYPQDSCDMYYNPNGELRTKVELIACYKEDYPIMIKYYYAAPAYCEVLDWLIGKRIYIDIDCTAKAKWYCYMWEGSSSIGATGDYIDREQAINAAIVRVLEELQ